ncbi:radical SAM protein [Mariprofundus sp. NF]|uniref:radical SAM/SPASM domain-containing protein n=1 Tax=Mariprofundus sp. NF TaxID=2608716 RepID=UPI00159FAE03|nr:radical SAM/SPASM domain-containing protein [Mariprofundus sp. NF]NWF39541.1 radical SAM protein [Mariprofundus sp. NF]
MDFITWAKGRTLPKALQSREGWAQFFEHYRTEEPHIHQIEPTNRCPYTCVMCPRNDNMTRKQGNMEMGLFRKIIDEASTYSEKVREKEIELFHFGESLFHPQLAEMVAYSSSAGLRPTLSINPADLNSGMIDDLLKSAPYKIIISLDSMTDKRYRAIRGEHAEIDRAVENTELLLQRHQQLESNTIISIRMIVMNLNEDEVEDFRNFWQERGGVVELRDFFPWSKNELQELGRVEKYPAYMPCPFPWQYLVAQWNGDVVACCRDYNGLLKLGNVADSTLKEIWNGPAYTEFRRKMASGRGLTSFCEECLSIYYSEPT